MAYTLSIVEVAEALDQEVEDMFLRLQNGMPLNSAEKRNAISGAVRNFVHETAEDHKLMTVSVPFKNTRYHHDEMVAQMLRIELNGGPASLHNTQLTAIYRNSKGFRKTSPQIRQLKRVMNSILSRAFPEKSPELTKVNLLSLYTVASEALTKYSLSNRAPQFGKWFVEFENRRRLEEGKPEDEREDRMVSYQIAVLQQTASLASQQVRSRILMQDLVATISDLALLDNRRLFTHEQRIAIFRKANGRCQNHDSNPDCETDCRWDNFHADHIVPHSSGGKTIVDNGQLLCASCNLKKAASTQ